MSESRNENSYRIFSMICLVDQISYTAISHPYIVQPTFTWFGSQSVCLPAYLLVSPSDYELSFGWYISDPKMKRKK